MTPNPNPSPELLPCPFCGGEAERYTSSVGVGFENRQVQCRQCGASAFDAKWQARALSPQTLPAPGDVERLRQALRNIAEGNLGDQPWQANYARIKDVATEALASQPVTTEPFGYWVEQRLAEPVLLRKPAYIPEPSDLRTVTPLYAFPTLATVAAANDEGVALLLAQAEFLCDRLDELDWSQDLDGVCRDYSGHVDPALSRLKSTIQSLATSRSQHEGAE